MHPRVWEASGHVSGFVDPLVDCRNCKKRFRADDAKIKGTKYDGLDRFEARKKVLADLQAQKLLVSEKPYKLRMPRSGRTGARC